MSVARMSVRELLGVEISTLESIYRSREKSVEARVQLPLALRLDGVGFKRCLKGFREPRDQRVHEALVRGALELLRRFSASCAYVVSDEVSLMMLGPSLPYGGRVEKLVSISASILSSTASLALGRSLIFDSRVIPLEGVDDAKRYVVYRARVGLNNYVGSTLRALGLRMPEGSKLERQLEELEEAGVRMEERPAWEWGGSCVYWRVDASGRVPVVEEGPWRLLEAFERYRAPESEQRKG